jgi:hypothetical protein
MAARPATVGHNQTFPPVLQFNGATMLVHIIYTEAAVFLSKKGYPSWRDIQGEFPDYKASLGPWKADAVTEYLQGDYSDLVPPAATQVAELLRADAVLRQLTFLA